MASSLPTSIYLFLPAVWLVLAGCNGAVSRQVGAIVLETQGSVSSTREETPATTSDVDIKSRPSNGDIIETGIAGHLDLALLPGALVTLEPDSQLLIEENKLGKKGLRFRGSNAALVPRSPFARDPPRGDQLGIGNRRVDRPDSRWNNFDAWAGCLPNRRPGRKDASHRGAGRLGVYLERWNRTRATFSWLCAGLALPILAARPSEPQSESRRRRVPQQCPLSPACVHPIGRLTMESVSQSAGPLVARAG